MARRIVAIGGDGFSTGTAGGLDDYILGLSGRTSPKVCFVGTASGDSNEYLARFYAAFAPPRCLPSHLNLFDRQVADLEAFVCAQDVIYVGGGNTANMLNLWRLHGLDRALEQAWQRGVLLCGVSAGGLCWFEGGITDSFGLPHRTLKDGLGLLPGSFCPHYHLEPQRRHVYRQAVGQGMAAGYACDDAVALHFEGTDLVDVITTVPTRCAYRVALESGRVVEVPLRVRLLGPEHGADVPG